MTKFFAGHRGSSATHPENTMIAFKNALSEGVTCIELDVVRSSDGIVFVMHDDSVDRTTNGTGNSCDLAWETVAALDAGSWKSEIYAGEKVPAFTQVLDYFRNQPTFLLIEIKYNINYTNIGERVARLITERKMDNQCLIMSYDWSTVTKVKKGNPNIKTGLLDSGISVTNGITYALANGHSFISLDYCDVTKPIVDQIHKAGLELNVWAVDSEKDIQNMIDLGVDSISGNYTTRLKAAADKNCITQIRPTSSVIL